jgi:hypothetical protein
MRARSLSVLSRIGLSLNDYLTYHILYGVAVMALDLSGSVPIYHPLVWFGQ